MSDSVVRVRDNDNNSEAIARAAGVLRDGGLLAFPTETVYGLGARADIPGAISRLREVKGREANKAFTVHLADPENATEFVPDLSGIASRLIKKAWPGPLTLILSVDDPSAAPIMAGRDEQAASTMYFENAVGLRCPADEVARAILREVNGPVVAASANPAGAPPPKSGRDVERSLAKGDFDLLIDTGDTRYAKASTIVRMTGKALEVLRVGVFDERMITDMAKLHLLFVCTGNTCRSPMASGLAAHLLAKRLCCDISALEDHGVIIESAGTAGGWGSATAQAVEVMQRRKISILGHESTALSLEQIRRADHIFAMTTGHRNAILRLAPDVADRVALLMGDKDVADPLGGSVEDYERCAGEIERGLAERLREIDL